MSKILDIDEIRQRLDEADIYEDYDGNKIQTVYIGDIRDMTPSGKVYTPFACSNVTPCERCKGTTQIKNKHYKKKKWTKIHNRLNKLTRNAIDIYGFYDNWPKTIIARRKKLKKQEVHWAQYLLCPECRGLGSLEARLDQDYLKQLQSELDEIDAWHHLSESDGCDILISRRIAYEQHD